MDRREFLKRSALLAAGVVVGQQMLAKAFPAESAVPAPKKKVIGLQTYSLREAMKEDVPGTLRKIADMGYTTLETASYGDGKVYGYAPAEFRKMVEDLGMRVTSSHLGHPYTRETDAEVMAWWDKALDTQKAVGCTYAIQPSYPIGKTLDDIKLYCDYFNKVGEMANGRGLKFGFHNHAREFDAIDGQVIYDYMLANTDPAKVIYELDVYWCGKGGKDPVHYITDHSDRIRLLHIKDECAIGESGQIDFKPIFKAAYKAGIDEYFVEVERYTQNPENDVARSYDFLEVAKYVK